MSQVNVELSFLREQLLAKRKSEDLNTEVQSLQTRIASLEEERRKLQEMLESAREEAANLRRDLEQREQTVSSGGSEDTRTPGWSVLLNIFSHL